MEKLNISKLLQSGPVFLDGATGTNLQEAGLPVGVCPEQWIYDNPDAILKLQKEYIKNGSQILYTPTFTANRIKLAEFGLSDRIEDINRRMVSLTREAAGDKAYVAADFTMTGHQLYPVGDLDFEELVDIYKEQAACVLKEQVDLFVVETMMSLNECRAAVLAIKESCDLPIMVSLTYNDDGRTLFGSKPDTCMLVLQAMGVDVVGLNCSTGPNYMIPLVEEMKKVAKVPILAKPNAGMPELVDGKSVYPMGPEEFADNMKLLVEAGASVIGGCCGTTPDHIKAMHEKLSGSNVYIPDDDVDTAYVTSERLNVKVKGDGKFIVIGERINPTGKKALQEELRAGSMKMVGEFARAQAADGASILDINMGTNGIDEKQSMVDAVNEVAYSVDLPLCIDSSYVEVVEAALRIYPGRALINSVSAEKEKMKALLPLAKKYGAMFILLPLSDEGLPKTIEDKKKNIHTVLEEAEKYGIKKEDAIVDLLVSTIGADSKAAVKCFETAKYCRDTLHLPTVCGLSNISFGLPQRAFVNAAFLLSAMSCGLSMAIANPSQKMIMYLSMASDMLYDVEGAVDKYLERVPAGNIEISAVGSDTQKEKQDMHPLMACVVNGNESDIVNEVNKELENGTKPSEVINDYLIKGINLVGKYYEEKTFFLPQLISAANAMKKAMDYLEPMLLSDSTEKKSTIVVATVEGDIHDIGKNLVVLMLKNYGYDVVDLGKDIPAEEIVETAIMKNAAVIGLSALMTTTMMRMKEVVSLAKEKKVSAKIVIGGACITESFAKEIGADGYSADAADCVKLIEKLVG